MSELGTFGGSSRSPNGVSAFSGSGAFPEVKSEGYKELLEGAAGTYNVTRVKLGVFTRASDAATGTQAVTGIGFRPAVVLLLCQMGNDTEGSWGFDDAVSAKCMFDRHNNGANTRGSSNTLYSIYFEFAAAGADAQAANLSSMDIDGFTTSFTALGSPPAGGTLNCMYAALGTG